MNKILFIAKKETKTASLKHSFLRSNNEPLYNNMILKSIVNVWDDEINKVNFHDFEYIITSYKTISPYILLKIINTIKNTDIKLINLDSFDFLESYVSLKDMRYKIAEIFLKEYKTKIKYCYYYGDFKKVYNLYNLDNELIKSFSSIDFEINKENIKFYNKENLHDLVLDYHDNIYNKIFNRKRDNIKYLIDIKLNIASFFNKFEYFLINNKLEETDEIRSNLKNLKKTYYELEEEIKKVELKKELEEIESQMNRIKERIDTNK